MKPYPTNEARPAGSPLPLVRRAFLGALGFLVSVCAAIAGQPNIPGHQDTVFSVRNKYGEPINVDITSWFSPVPIFHGQADTFPVSTWQIFHNSHINNGNGMSQPGGSDGWYAGKWKDRNGDRALRAYYMVQQIPRPGNFQQGYWYTNRSTGADWQARGVQATSMQRVYLDVWMAYWRQPNVDWTSIGGHDYDWEHFTVQLEYLPGVALLPMTLTIAQHATHYTLRWANWAKDTHFYRGVGSKNPWGSAWSYPGIYVSRTGHGFFHYHSLSANWYVDDFDSSGNYMWLPGQINNELVWLNPNATCVAKSDYQGNGKTRYIYDRSLYWGDTGKSPYDRLMSRGSRGYYDLPAVKTQSGYSGAQQYSLFKNDTLGSINRDECNNGQAYRLGCAYWSTSK